MANGVAFVFPGQGSQYPGMGKGLYDNFPEAREVFDLASEALGYDMASLCFTGSEEDIKRTEKTQPAILTVSVAALRVLEANGVRPLIVAGHSLGEYSALVCAGSIAFEDAVRVVSKRGRFMQEAVPQGKGTMAAILGLSSARVVEVCLRVSPEGRVTAANFNQPTQVVIAGEKRAVDEAMQEAKKEGAKRVLLLPMSVPSHCGMMAPARERLSKELEKIEFADLSVPLVANVDAGETVSGRTSRDNLERQLTSPVRWSDSMARVALKVATVVEVGPGRVLTGLMKRINRDVRGFNVEGPESLEKTLGHL